MKKISPNSPKDENLTEIKEIQREIRKEKEFIKELKEIKFTYESLISKFPSGYIPIKNNELSKLKISNNLSKFLKNYGYEILVPFQPDLRANFENISNSSKLNIEFEKINLENYISKRDERILQKELLLTQKEDILENRTNSYQIKVFSFILSFGVIMQICFYSYSVLKDLNLNQQEVFIYPSILFILIFLFGFLFSLFILNKSKFKFNK